MAAFSALLATIGQAHDHCPAAAISHPGHRNRARNGSAGFARLVLRPHPGGELSWASGSYRCVRGPVSAGWRRSGDTFTYRAEVPPNVTASVRIPSDDPSQVRDRSGRPPTDIAAFPGAGGLQEAVFEVGSGTHQFSGPAISEPSSH